MGTLDQYEGVIADYVAATGIPFLAINYQLAPEATGMSQPEEGLNAFSTAMRAVTASNVNHSNSTAIPGPLPRTPRPTWPAHPSPRGGMPPGIVCCQRHQVVYRSRPRQLRLPGRPPARPVGRPTSIAGSETCSNVTIAYHQETDGSTTCEASAHLFRHL